ncbi:MAG TPA: cache domain-containing protein, partial [Candidatus Ozemobacteraceae bacterium]|nr:cache domain-containing protein [Candidatus Ozemobacteraceae bacterium]
MKSFTFQAIVSVVLALLIFFLAVFLKILPAFERAILEQKREMIRELTNSAWNILARFETDERAGRLTRDEAQKQAVQQIRNLHYGREMKDYFWINDF